MITAHSGCDRTEDNSLEFIRYALDQDVGAFEVDVRKNSRGMLILSHDETQEEAVPLADAYALLAAHPEKKINLDLKQRDLEDDVVTLARQYRVENQLIFTGDVNKELFRKGAVRYPQVAWFANPDCFQWDFEVWQQSGITETEELTRLEEILEEMLDYEAAGLNWYYGTVEKIWQKATAMGIGISVWTVNEPELQKTWLSRQVANITTRNVAQIVGIRDRNI